MNCLSLINSLKKFKIVIPYPDREKDNYYFQLYLNCID